MPLAHTHAHSHSVTVFFVVVVVVLKILLRPDLDKCFYNSRKSGLNNLIKKRFEVFRPMGFLSIFLISSSNPWYVPVYFMCAANSTVERCRWMMHYTLLNLQVDSFWFLIAPSTEL